MDKEAKGTKGITTMIRTLFRACLHGFVALNLFMCAIYGCLLQVVRDALYGLAATGFLVPGRGIEELPAITRALVQLPSKEYFGAHYTYLHILLIPCLILIIMTSFIQLKRSGDDVDTLLIVMSLLGFVVTQCAAACIGLSLLFPFLPQILEIEPAKLQSTFISNALFWISMLCGILAACFYTALIAKRKRE